jgi:hypothetical protein
MSDAHSKASRKRMAKFSTEELSERMRAVAVARWAKSTKKQRAAVGAALKAARLNHGEVRRILM